MAAMIFALIVGASLNLRTVLSVVGGSSNTIAELLSLSPSIIGSISTISIIGLAFGALAARLIIPKLGLYQTTLYSLLGTVAAFALLTLENAVAIVISVAVSGFLAGIIGTALPSVVRLTLPPQQRGMGIAFMMAGTSLGTAAAGFLIGWSISVHAHWRPSVIVLLGIGLLAFVLWMIPSNAKTYLICQGRPASMAPAPTDGDSPALPAARAPIPRWVVFLTAFLGLQSVIVFAQIAWLVPTVTEWGGSIGQATTLLSILTGAQIIGGVLAPIIATKFQCEGALIFASAAMILLGSAGIAFFSVQFASLMGVQVSALLLACGHGATFAVVNLVLSTRSPDHLATARNTSFCMMASQFVAAAGPFYFSLVAGSFGFGIAWTTCTILGAILVLSSFPVIAALKRSTQVPAIAARS